MTYSYYPGCTLKSRAQELDKNARSAAEALGVTLEEIPDWQCCGAVYPQASDEIATRLSSVRALDSARAAGQDVVTLCSACHHVIKRVNHDMQTNADIRDKVNAYLELETPYTGETNVIHYLELLRDKVGFDALKKKVVNPLKGRSIAAYYGCMLLRPSAEMQFDDPENPTIIEDFIKAIGAEPVVFPYRNECCGGYVAMDDNALPRRLVDTIVGSAMENGAQEMITACPLCMYNLDANSTAHKLPIHYFTELLAEALGVKQEVE